MHPDFDLPGKGRIDGRTSTITAAFFQAITPVIIPSDEEVDEALAILGMARGKCSCAYCGDTRTEWDHFRPIVVNRQPTGYITEIANLVPACGKCNQSKGNKYWKNWMQGSAALSPRSRRIADLDVRIEKLAAYEQWRKPVCINYAALTGPTKWAKYIQLLDKAVESLSAAQKTALEFQAVISSSLSANQEHYRCVTHKPPEMHGSMVCHENASATAEDTVRKLLPDRDADT